MNACYCTGACARTGRCPNSYTIPTPTPNPFPGTYPNRMYPQSTQAAVIIQPYVSEERIRAIIREELDREIPPKLRSFWAGPNCACSKCRKIYGGTA